MSFQVEISELSPEGYSQDFKWLCLEDTSCENLVRGVFEKARQQEEKVNNVWKLQELFEIDNNHF